MYFTAAEMRETAETLARYRIPSLAYLRKTEKEDMAAFIRDIRETDRWSFPPMRLTIRITGHISPRQLSSRPNERDPKY